MRITGETLLQSAMRARELLAEGAPTSAERAMHANYLKAAKYAPEEQHAEALRFYDAMAEALVEGLAALRHPIPIGHGSSERFAFDVPPPPPIGQFEPDAQQRAADRVGRAFNGPVWQAPKSPA